MRHIYITHILCGTDQHLNYYLLLQWKMHKNACIPTSVYFLLSMFHTSPRNLIDCLLPDYEIEARAIPRKSQISTRKTSQGSLFPRANHSTTYAHSFNQRALPAHVIERINHIPSFQKNVKKVFLDTQAKRPPTG